MGLVKLRSFPRERKPKVKTLCKHEDKTEYLENQSLRNNIRIDGITEEGNGTWLETETRAKQLLKEKLNLECEPEIKRAYRVGSKPRTRVPNVADGSTTKTRTLVCRLRDWKQKEGILRAARQKNQRVYLFVKTLQVLFA